jgi:hypothetical protein
MWQSKNFLLQKHAVHRENDPKSITIQDEAKLTHQEFIGVPQFNIENPEKIKEG